MFYIIDNMVVGGDISNLSLPTDTIDDEVWELYCQDRDAYKIENGKFIKLKDESELRNKALNKKYILNELSSVTNFIKSYIKTNPIQDTDMKISVSGLYENWELGKYEVGDIRNHAGQTWECIQTHDNAVYPDINPDNVQTWANFWKPLHGKSINTARPWVKPQYGTTDMYRVGEYMIWTDGSVKKALRDTVYSPEEYAADWQDIL